MAIDRVQPAKDLKTGVTAGDAGAHLEGHVLVGRVVGIDDCLVVLAIRRTLVLFNGAPHLLVAGSRLDTREPVDAGQEGEVVESLHVFEERGHRSPGGAVNAHPEIPVGELGAEYGITEGAPDGIKYGLTGRIDRDLSTGLVGWRLRRRCAHRATSRMAEAPPTMIGSPRQRSAMSSCWIRSWSRTMPSRSASGRGGQPGT